MTCDIYTEDHLRDALKRLINVQEEAARDVAHKRFHAEYASQIATTSSPAP